MGESRAGPWVAPLGVGVVVVVILVVVSVAAARDDDSVPAGDDPAPSSTSGTPETSTTPSEEVPSADPHTSPEPVDTDITGPAFEAIEDGFPAMIPAELPPGWKTGKATYTPGHGAKEPTWELSFVLADGGEVVLTQSTLSLEKAVPRYLGADAVDAGRVDLRDWGTGYWRAYTVGPAAGLGKAMPTETSVVIAAPDQDSSVTLAKYLLTAEDSNIPEAG